MGITVEIIIPGELPDLNAIIAASKSHYGKYSRLKAEYTNLVVWLSKSLPPMDRVYISCHWICKDKRRDMDNVAVGIKFILDGLVKAGVLKNDGWKQIAGIGHRFSVDKDNPRVEVILDDVDRGKGVSL